MNKSKFLWISFFTLTIAVFFFLYLSGGDGYSSSEVVQESNVSVQAIPSVVPLAPVQVKPELQNTVAGQERVELWYSPSGWSQIELWQESRGWGSITIADTYRNYGRETIQKLADSGDINALHRLAELQAREGASMEQVVSTYLDAAVRGSSSALGMIGSSLGPWRSSRFSGADGEVQYKKEMLEALSYYEVALLRGDKTVRDSLNSTKSRIKLTAEDEKYVLERGAQLYKELESRRISLGLGPFDNSVPAVVNDYFEAESKRTLLNLQPQ